MRWADDLVADALTVGETTDAEALRLFAHIASVEHLWYSRILGRAPDVAVWPALGVSEARELASRHADLFHAMVAEADATALGRLVTYRNSKGRTYESSVADIVVHVCMHGGYHRGQIARQLRAAGREPPYTDYIEFTRRDQ
ncbi:MAG TPA: DinB family protein [Gemmatimonadaceae bacterium]